MGDHALSDERVRKLGVTVVAAMEREMRQIVLEKHRHKDLETKRLLIDAAHQDLERRKELDRQALIEQHAIRGAEHRERTARVREFHEQERQRLFHYELMKRKRAEMKQEHVKREREALHEQARLEGEAKNEQMRQVREELGRVEDARRAAVMNNIQKHDELYAEHLEKRQQFMEEHKRKHLDRHQHHEGKREMLKQHQQQVNRRLEARMREKHEQAHRVKADREEKVTRLNQLKDDVRTRKEDLRAMIAWADRTDNFHDVERTLDELKAQSVSLSYKGYVYGDEEEAVTPRARPTLSPATLKSSMKNFDKTFRLNSSSTRATSTLSTPEKFSFANVSPRPQSAPSTRRGLSGTLRSPDSRKAAVSPPSSSYDHLMSYYKARVAPISPQLAN